MNLLSIMPELVLFSGAVITLMVDVFLGKRLTNISRISFLIAFTFAVASLILVINGFENFYLVFNKMFFVNYFSSFIKIVILVLLILVIFISADFVAYEKRISSEFLALLMIATVGSMILISSSDLLLFYMALELQSLPLYLLASIKRSSIKSSESGVKYFVLGSVASGILLLGISLVYGFSGTTNLVALSHFYFAQDPSSIPLALMLGFTLVLVAMFFKISAVPFHMWTPDVYQGSTTIVTTFFASMVKFVSVIALVSIYFNLVLLWKDSYQILALVAVLSILVGSFGAIRQTNLKRLLAYSSIGHAGFALAGLAAFGISAVKAIVFYMIIYSTLSLGGFAFLLLLFSQKQGNSSEDEKNDQLYELSSIAGIGKKNPLIALMMAIIMFSTAGIPPMAGFFSKFYILLAIVDKGLYWLAIVAVLASVVSAFYYLRVIKVMYFDESKEESEIELIKINNSSIVLFLMAFLNLTAVFYLNPLVNLISRVF